MLWMVCLASALGVVHTGYEVRKLTQNLEQLRRQATAKRVLSGQLLLERSTWSSYSRIEKIASENLAMHRPNSASTVIVKRASE